MNPLRPTSDQNAPYREAIQALADGYGYVPNHGAQTLSLSLVNCHDQSLGSRTNPIEIPSSSDPVVMVEIEDIRRAFRQWKFYYEGSRGVTDWVVMDRLNEVNLSAQTMVDVVNILKQPMHPFMRELQTTRNEACGILYHLAGILRTRGWGKSLQRDRESIK